MTSKQGMLAAQFLLGQRYIDAFGKQARKENTFITRVDLGYVSSNVDDSLKMIPQNK
jgi:hypothetical protein